MAYDFSAPLAIFAPALLKPRDWVPEDETDPFARDSYLLQGYNPVFFYNVLPYVDPMTFSALLESSEFLRKLFLAHDLLFRFRVTCRCPNLLSQLSHLPNTLLRSPYGSWRDIWTRLISTSSNTLVSQRQLHPFQRDSIDSLWSLLELPLDDDVDLQPHSGPKLVTEVPNFLREEEREVVRGRSRWMGRVGGLGRVFGAGAGEFASMWVLAQLFGTVFGMSALPGILAAAGPASLLFLVREYFRGVSSTITKQQQQTLDSDGANVYNSKFSAAFLEELKPGFQQGLVDGIGLPFATTVESWCLNLASYPIEFISSFVLGRLLGPTLSTGIRFISKLFRGNSRLLSLLRWTAQDIYQEATEERRSAVREVESVYDREALLRTQRVLYGIIQARAAQVTSSIPLIDPISFELIFEPMSLWVEVDRNVIPEFGLPSRKILKNKKTRMVRITYEASNLLRLLREQRNVVNQNFEVRSLLEEEEEEGEDDDDDDEVKKNRLLLLRDPVTNLPIWFPNNNDDSSDSSFHPALSIEEVFSYLNTTSERDRALAQTIHFHIRNLASSFGFLELDERELEIDRRRTFALQSSIGANLVDRILRYAEVEDERKMNRFLAEREVWERDRREDDWSWTVIGSGSEEVVVFIDEEGDRIFVDELGEEWVLLD